MSLARWYVVMFELGAGASIAGYWSWVIATKRLAGLIADLQIARAHVRAEFLTAALLMAGGIGLLIDGDAAWASAVAGLGAGALLYAVVSSPALYPTNAMARVSLYVGGAFAVLAIVALLAG